MAMNDSDKPALEKCKYKVILTPTGDIQIKIQLVQCSNKKHI